MECVFCEIVRGQSPSTILFESDNILIIKDLYPASEHHYLAIPKRHIVDASQLISSDLPLVTEMETQMRLLFGRLGMDSTASDLVSIGYHWPPYITVDHLHLHGIAPVEKMSKLGHWKYTVNNIRYCTPQFVYDYLRIERRQADT